MIGGQGRGQGNYNSRENNANAHDGNDGNDGLTVPMDVEDAYLKTWVPSVVMYHRSFQCCEADNCQYQWTPNEMEAPHNMLFQMQSYRWGSDAKNSRHYRQNILSNAYFCIHHMSCLSKQDEMYKKNHLYEKLLLSGFDPGTCQATSALWILGEYSEKPSKPHSQPKL